MATDDRQVLVTGVAATPASFVIPGSGQIQPKSVFAHYDGSGAASPFLPALKIVSDGGEVVGIYPASQTVPAGGSADVSWFPRVSAAVLVGTGAGCVFYVGPPTGVAAIDRATLQAAHDSLPATGGIVQMCRGTYNLGTADPALTFTKPIQLTGHGRTPQTQLTYQNSTGTAISITGTNAHILRDFELVYNGGATPTAGFGINVSGNASGSQYLGVTVNGFWWNWAVTAGNSWIMQRCVNINFIQVGLRIDNTVNGDQGDMQVIGNFFFDGAAGNPGRNSLDWRGGGGLRLIGNKFNAPSPGNSNTSHTLLGYQQAANTGVLLIMGNSIENAGQGVNVVSHPGSGTLQSIVVACNEIDVQSNCVLITPALAGVYNSISIASNIFQFATNGINMANIDNITNGGNVFAVGTPVVVGGGVTNHVTYGIG